MSSHPQTFDLFDKSGQKASITLKWGEEWGSSHKLIYIRKDLLEKFLKKKAYELIWGIWGERQYKVKGNEGLTEFAKKYKTYKVFQKIISYKDIFQ